MAKTALITGASSGIGYELSKLFAGDKFDLVITARNQSRLDEIADELANLYGIKVKAIAIDLAIQGSAEHLFNRLKLESIEIDVLVNNAGFAVYGLFAESSLKNQIEMLNLNMISLTALTGLFLPGMIARRYGKIMNVASTAAFQPGPLMAGYYATKAYVLSFSEALANELKDTGVTVTTLCPGPTYTGFQKRAGLGKSPLFQGKHVMTAEQVAEIGYRGLMNNKTLVITGMSNRLLIMLTKFLPRQLVIKSVRKIQETRQ